MNIAIAIEKVGDYIKSLDEFKEILKIDPSSTDAIINMSIIAAKLGDEKKCLDMLITASEHNPYDIRFYVAISNIYIKIGCHFKSNIINHHSVC